MIYGGVSDNLHRVRILNSIAKDYFKLTADTDFRRRMLTSDDVFPFDVISYNQMEAESCMVGVLMAWSVVALESIANYLIAEKTDDKELAVNLIEYPSRVIKNSGEFKSDLTKKLIYLAGLEHSRDILIVAEGLVDARNGIVHDKPFDYVDNGNGEFSVNYIRARGRIDNKYHYDEIELFFERCNNVIKFLMRHNVASSLNLLDLNLIS